MQQIYGRTPMPKCDFIRVAKQLYGNYTSAWIFSFKFAAYSQDIFSQEHLLLITVYSTKKDETCKSEQILGPSIALEIL